MSVTFFIPNSPTTSTEETCMCAQMAPRFDAQFRGEVTLDEIRGELKEFAWEHCKACRGTGVMTWDEPEEGCEFNLANTNARVLLQLAGLDAVDLCGSVAHADLPAVVRRLVLAMNSEGTRGAFVRETTVQPAVPGAMVPVRDGSIVRLERQGGSPEVIWGGLSDEGLVERVSRLLNLFRLAQERGSEVCWG